MDHAPSVAVKRISLKPLALAFVTCALVALTELSAAGTNATPACAGFTHPAAVSMRGTVVSHAMSGAFSELVDPGTGRTISHWTLDGLHQAAGSSGTMRWTQDFSGTTHWLDSNHAKAVAATA